MFARSSVQHLKTHKVKEHVYRRQHAAENKVVDYIKKQTHEFVVCTPEPFTTFTLRKTLMNQATWNFKLDTLIHEIEMHKNRDELINLLHEQVEDDRNCKYSNT